MYYFDIERKEVFLNGDFYCAFSSARIEMTDTIQQAHDKMSIYDKETAWIQ